MEVALLSSFEKLAAYQWCAKGDSILNAHTHIRALVHMDTHVLCLYPWTSCILNFCKHFYILKQNSMYAKNKSVIVLCLRQSVKVYKIYLIFCYVFFCVAFDLRNGYRASILYAGIVSIVPVCLIKNSWDFVSFNNSLSLIPTTRLYLLVSYAVCCYDGSFRCMTFWRLSVISHIGSKNRFNE